MEKSKKLNKYLHEKLVRCGGWLGISHDKEKEFNKNPRFLSLLMI
jgi:hypothetical protein